MTTTAETMNNVVTAMTGGSACMFDTDGDGDLVITVLGATQGPNGAIGTKDEFQEEEEELRTIVVSGTVEIEWRAVVEEDAESRIDDLDTFASEVAEAVRFQTDLVSNVNVDGYTVHTEWEGSDVNNVDWDEE